MQSARHVSSFFYRSLAALLSVALLVPSVSGAEIERQRELFLSVYESVERGNWGVVDALPDGELLLLRDYALWPDLRAAWFRANLKTASHQDIDAFLDHHGVLKPARELRYRYALHLAKTGDLGAYLNIYQTFYQGLGIATLDCLALQAELNDGKAQRVVNRARDLWTIGKSQVKECDPVFTFLADGNHIGLPDYIKRFELAVNEREFTMARWLGKSIDQKHIDIASQWMRVRKDPESFVRNEKKWINDAATREQLIYAIERVTYADPVLALELWNGISRGGRFAAEDEFRTERHIALWTARDNLPGAYQLLQSLPDAAQNDEVLRWRARTSLRKHNWTNLLVDIGRMSADERQTEEWRYWRAVAMQNNDRVQEAETVFNDLAAERSYYGFLSADELGLDYALTGDRFVPDETKIAELQARPDLIRARELFLVGLEGRGRSEWDAVASYLDTHDQTQAAILAHRWGWHSRAIAAAAKIGDYDDLSLRYPLPYSDTFQRYAEDANISPTWAYGVARSESLFMRDVRSSAGAIGLMQLMPATGKTVAREIRLPYSGLSTLTNPDSNIRLGTSYLGQMAERYGGNRVLATAAYNAGPHRVDAWLPQSGEIDARAWIETIPFNETRGYVRRVLAAETIFHWRMTGQVRRLSDELLVVRADSKQEQVAKN
jgi:soluble lytic murein transglycosylase